MKSFFKKISPPTRGQTQSLQNEQDLISNSKYVVQFAIPPIQHRRQLRANSTQPSPVRSSLPPLPQEVITKIASCVFNDENSGLDQLLILSQVNRQFNQAAAEISHAEADQIYYVENKKQFIVAVQGLKNIGATPNVINSQLTINSTRISASVSKEMFHFLPTELRSLRLEGDNITTDCLKVLSKNHNLEKIHLEHASRIKKSGFVAISKIPTLRTLALRFEEEINPAISLFSRNKNLNLNLFIKNGKEENISAIPNIENIKLLVLHDASSVTDERLASIFQNRKIQYLRLHGSQVTDSGLKAMPDMPDLSSFILNGASITDAGILFMLPHTPKLKFLSLWGCNISLSTVEFLEDKGIEIYMDKSTCKR
jgi:hypothetical protein